MPFSRGRCPNLRRCTSAPPEALDSAGVHQAPICPRWTELALPGPASCLDWRLSPASERRGDRRWVSGGRLPTLRPPHRPHYPRTSRCWPLAAAPWAAPEATREATQTTARLHRRQRECRTRRITRLNTRPPGAQPPVIRTAQYVRTQPPFRPWFPPLSPPPASGPPRGRLAESRLGPPLMRTHRRPPLFPHGGRRRRRAPPSVPPRRAWR